jgi:hypothetical protein
MVNKDIPTLKIEHQEQREQFTFYFSENALENP